MCEALEGCVLAVHTRMPRGGFSPRGMARCEVTTANSCDYGALTEYRYFEFCSFAQGPGLIPVLPLLRECDFCFVVRGGYKYRYFHYFASAVLGSGRANCPGLTPYATFGFSLRICADAEYQSSSFQLDWHDWPRI